MDANKQLANMKGITYRSYNDAFANNFYYSYANGCPIAPPICPPSIGRLGKKAHDLCWQKKNARAACIAQKDAAKSGTNAIVDEALNEQYSDYGDNSGTNNSNEKSPINKILLYGGIGLGIIIIGISTYLIVRKK